MTETKQPGNANLLIGRTAGNANLPIGSLQNQTANQEIGVPGLPGWHSRGYLPHFDGAQKTQHVTFHLADSLPKDVLERFDEEIKSLPMEKRDVERRKRVEEWIDAGHGSCVLREPDVAAMVQNTLLIFDAQRYRLLAWVVMPNHVHVLFQPMNGWTLAKILASWKKFTARKICDYLRTAGNANLLIGSQRKQAANQEIGVPGIPGIRPIWHREYWDRYMRDERHFQQAMEYIHHNPVKAGLADKAEDWRWSSVYPENITLVADKRDFQDEDLDIRV